MFIKNYCESNKVDGLLVSLDAKKAFDSVDHNYICRVLKEYGVGDRFIKYFKVLYKDLTVRVLVNGHFSEKINIERGVKQGDALSCSLFILCIDPLIRNINANVNIEGINLTSKITRNATTIKCSGYADDIAIVCKNSLRNVQEIFREYERLTRLSGLELNADKTEILRIGVNKNSILTISVKYCGIQYQIKSITSIKICGIYFCSDIAIEYDYNILEKIEKLEVQLRKWMCRSLTIEGKILIIKTFGLSQLIYNLQCYPILEKDLLLIEKLIFKFIWSKDWNKVRVCERIKRSVLKNEYQLGGMNAPDVECLNKALKLKQFIRASNSNHHINLIQKICMEKMKYSEVVKHEYSSLCKEDEIIKTSQVTINLLTDLARKECFSADDNGESSTIAINAIGSINLQEFLSRKNKPLESCISKSLNSEGIENLGDLLE
jgi:hypothetical protein